MSDLSDQSDHEFQVQLNWAIAKSLEDADPPRSRLVSQHKPRETATATMFETNDVTRLDFEEQVRYVVEKSRLESNIADSDSEEDVLRKALQISQDPNEQISPEMKDLMHALRKSCDQPQTPPPEDAEVNLQRGHTRHMNVVATPLVKSLSELQQDRRTPVESSASSCTFSRVLSSKPSSLAAAPRSASHILVGGTIAPLAMKNSPLLVTDHSEQQRPVSKSPGNRRRPIIIDGCNVAFQHGKNERFSAKGLLIMYKHFVRRYGYTNREIYIFCKPVSMSEEDKEICNHLHMIDVLVWTPSRKAGEHVYTSDDDLIILEKAKEVEGVVVSLDQFKDSFRTHKYLRPVIKDRVLQFMFKGDELMFAKDPLGTKGPTLDQFLRY